MTGSHVVTYAVDEQTTVAFEIAPPPGFVPAANDVVGRVRDAVEPAVRAAQVVLDRVREAAPDRVTVKFGLKVSGRVDWLVAKAATEGNFEVTLTWKRREPAQPDPDS
ncbi:MAG: hypothetical protein J2P15_15650 [Micromonosporaceae bacterium]|nr:hypothetical protein [Micromonosporaceae bacterium]